jgi:DNA helicase IV
LHRYKSDAAIEAAILERIESVDEYATIAVIVPTDQEAASWHTRLSRGLAAGRRPSSLSRREELTARFDVHFTNVYETKGLEFDVVIIPDLGAFEFDREIGRNQAYVAISRAKNALFIGCSAAKFEATDISALIDKGLILAIEIE